VAPVTRSKKKKALGKLEKSAKGYGLRIKKEKSKYLKMMKQQIQPMNHTAIQDRNKNLQLRKGQTL
jgi:hypothetical protein